MKSKDTRIEITPEILERVLARKWGLSDPCVICGHQFQGPSCQHTFFDTESVISRVKRMKAAEKKAIRERER